MTNQLVKCFHRPRPHCRKYSSPPLLKWSPVLSINDNVGGTMSTEIHKAKNMYTMDESGTAPTAGSSADVSPVASSAFASSFLYTPSKPTTRLTPTTKLLQPQSLSTSFTKGYYYYLYQYTFAQISSALLHLSSSASLHSLSKIQSLVTIILIISLNIPSSTNALGLYQQSSCETHGWNAFPVWKYRAKPRFVPPLNMDRKMQREFLELFRGGGHYKDDSSSSSEEDSYEYDFHLDVQELKRIADMCPKDAFFYSLSPNHLEATQSLARMLVAQPSPVEVLKLAKALLRSPYVNPKVWYTAIIAASQERPDMTGFKLAHPIDAIPDLFVPGPLLFEVMDKYRSALKKRSGEPVAVNGTFTNVHHHRQKRAFSTGYKVTRNKTKTPRRNGRNNETIVGSFSKIGHESQQKTKTSRNGAVKLYKRNNNRNSIKSHSGKPSASANDNSKLRSLFYSSAVASKLVKNKRKKISKNMKKADVAAALIGNVTEFQADSGMWKKARIDAFDDCIVVDGSVGVRNGIENKLWYFREDMMVNQHHWYWHQQFPLNATRQQPHQRRRGELFFYMHKNLVARYNAERLSNGLGIVPMFDIRPGAEIRTAYDSQLADVNSGKFWTPRPHGTPFTDIIHEDDPDFMRNLFVGQYNQLYGRLKRSIDVGHLLVGAIKTLKIRHTKGIEPLGNTVEASDLSVNPLFYDTMGFHNLGHQLIGLAADPKFKARLPTGVMADTLTTMRDPEFFSYHTVVDNLFDMYKKSLPPYKPRGFQADSGMWKKARIDAFDDCIVVDGSVGVRNGIENKLWYFREDMMVNQHHWYWHQQFPLNATRQQPHQRRRGELFFYMHKNLVARYNAERLSNGLGIVPMFDIRPGAEIRTAYDSQLADVNSGKFWTPRPHGTPFTDIIHEDDPDFMRNLFVGQYNQLYGRLKRSIDVGHLLVGAIKTLKIRHTKGIEPLGNTVEASDLSVNPLFYDTMGFHNLGHQLIGLAADPKFKARLPTGVMADTLTTMRDPEFFSYHTVVDNLFDMYKKSLPPYKPRGGEYPLSWDGVEILDVEAISKNGGHAKNQLRTFWSTQRYELEPGVDKSIHKGDLEVDVCAVHLNHEPFDFKITVTLDPCAHTKSNKGSVRIFLAPRYDEHGHRYSLTVQRRLMIHMDTFPVDLRVGRNVLYRRSFDSNALQPWSKSLKQYEHAPKHPHSADFCGCGWPTHLYIPKGSAEGTHFDVFVMLTNYDHDYVEEDPKDLPIPEPCNSPYMYCGIKWRQYPDAKPMGYPFDRLPFSVPIKCPRIGAGPAWSLLLCKFLQLFWNRPVASLEEFVSYAPNMASTVVEITHLDKLVW